MAGVAAYYDSPRITIYSAQADPASDSLDFAIDLRSETMTVIAAPGQNTVAAQAFNIERGLLDNAREDQFLPTTTGMVNVGTSVLFQQAIAQGISIVPLLPQDIALVSSLDISANAQAYITTALENGLNVIVPSKELSGWEMAMTGSRSIRQPEKRWGSLRTGFTRP